jgi:hypothetical protein
MRYIGDRYVSRLASLVVVVVVVVIVVVVPIDHCSNRRILQLDVYDIVQFDSL